MLVSFELSMPGNRSWNGKWSGDGECCAIVRSYRKPDFKLGYYTYSFGDGWVAAVTVREVTASVARMLRKKSRGFCGYDWMVDRIVNYGEILNDVQLADRLRGGQPTPAEQGKGEPCGWCKGSERDGFLGKEPCPKCKPSPAGEKETP